jgi:hypothetical protein
MPAVAIASPPEAATCTKGTFWPFIRDAGDCPTAAERANGVTSPAPVAASAPAATPVAQTNTVAAVQSPAATACGRSWLWPFIREAGDCQTSAEKGNGSTPVVPISASGPAAGPAADNPGSCHKGLFWPFVREAGDCPTDASKR